MVLKSGSELRWKEGCISLTAERLSYKCSMAQKHTNKQTSLETWLSSKEHLIFFKEPNLVPKAHVRWLTTTSKSSSRRANDPHMCGTHTHTRSHTSLCTWPTGQLPVCFLLDLVQEFSWFWLLKQRLTCGRAEKACLYFLNHKVMWSWCLSFVWAAFLACAQDEVISYCFHM